MGRGRMSTQAEPTEEPTEAELLEAVDLVQKGRIAVMRYGTRLALRMHSRDEELLKGLVRCFGGRYVPYSGTLRWTLQNAPLLAFIERVQGRVSPQVQQMLELVKGLVGVLGEAASHWGGGISVETQTAVLRNAAASAADRQREARGRALPTPTVADCTIPGEGPFDEDEPILALARDAAPETETTFRAQSSGAAKAFAEAAREAGMQTSVEDTFVRIRR